MNSAIVTGFSPFPQLTTPRLVLREVTDADVEEVFFLRSDPGVMRYTGQPPALNRAEIMDYIHNHRDSTRNGTGILWGIALRDQPKLIGLIAYRRFMREHFRGEVGYGLYPDHQGKGLAQEALGAIIEFGFSNIGLHSIEACVDKHNIPSIKLLERNGFEKEGHFKENYFFEGQFIDSVFYSLLSRDWHTAENTADKVIENKDGIRNFT